MDENQISAIDYKKLMDEDLKDYNKRAFSIRRELCNNQARILELQERQEELKGRLDEITTPHGRWSLLTHLCRDIDGVLSGGLYCKVEQGDKTWLCVYDGLYGNLAWRCVVDFKEVVYKYDLVDVHIVYIDIDGEPHELPLDPNDALSVIQDMHHKYHKEELEELAYKLCDTFGGGKFDIWYDEKEDTYPIEFSLYTNKDVNQIVYLPDFSLAALKEYMEDFDIDEEIETMRQDKSYREHFTIMESVEDYTDFKQSLLKAIDEVENS